MTPKTRVIVCGSSVYMASLAAGLQASPSLDVVRVLSAPSVSSDGFGNATGAVVVIDLPDAPADLPVTLLRERPGLLLVGMDPDSEELLVLSGRSAQALGIADLIRIIRGAESDP